jgi:glycerol-3-phosphate dehydrogenase
MSTAINLVTRQLIPQYAVGVTSNSRSTGANQGKKPQLLFIAPWRDFSLIGTVHAQLDGHPNEYRPRAEEIQRFIDEVNGAYPAASLEPGDVRLVHTGFLPARKSGNGASDKVKLIRRGQVRDHERDDGVTGLVSVVGVKYTTARSVAQSTVDLVVKKLGKTAPECKTDVAPVYGGQIPHFGPFLSEATAKRPEELSAEEMRHLVHNYGSEYHQVLKLTEQDPELARKVSSSSQVMKAEVVHAVMGEQAQKLTDVVFRRTELGSAGDPGSEALESCAAVMAGTLGWSEARKQQELDEVRAAFCLFR